MSKEKNASTFSVYFQIFTSVHIQLEIPIQNSPPAQIHCSPLHCNYSSLLFLYVQHNLQQSTVSSLTGLLAKSAHNCKFGKCVFLDNCSSVIKMRQITLKSVHLTSHQTGFLVSPSIMTKIKTVTKQKKTFLSLDNKVPVFGFRTIQQ